MDIDLIRFDFESTDPTFTNFRSLNGKCLVLYFYPKDSTPGCTLEGRDFAALKPEFDAYHTLVVGVSRDSCQSHQKFQDKQGLNFPLITDPNDILAKAFGVIKEKSLFANTFLGIERSTFLFDAQGHCCKAWRKVTVKGHAAAVLAAVKELDSSP